MRRFLRRLPDSGGQLVVINPLSLAGLELYLRSDQVSGADGSGVAAWTGANWPDISGNARHATLAPGATSPVLRKSGANLSPNGTQVVEWNGVTNNLRSVMGGPIDGSLGWTFIAFYKSVTLSGGHNNNIFECPVGQRFEYVANSNVGFNGYDRGDRPGFDMAPAPLTRKTWDPLATLGWHIQIVTLVPPIIAGGSVLGQMDGLAMTPSFSNWNCALEGSLYVGNNSGSNSDLEGCLAALIVYSRAYTGGTLAGLRAYLHSVFG